MPHCWSGIALTIHPMRLTAGRLFLPGAISAERIICLSTALNMWHQAVVTFVRTSVPTGDGVRPPDELHSVRMLPLNPSFFRTLNEEGVIARLVSASGRLAFLDQAAKVRLSPW